MTQSGKAQFTVDDQIMIRFSDVNPTSGTTTIDVYLSYYLVTA